MSTAFSVKAQIENAPLNKQQTLDYIGKLYKATYQYEDLKILGYFEKTFSIDYFNFFTNSI